MTTKHTEGKLKVIDWSHQKNNTVRIEKDTSPYTTIASMKKTDPDRIANARRLVSCWNACAGLADPSVVPEMLAALKQASNMIYDEYGAARQEWLDQCNKVICRASGVPVGTKWWEA